MNNELALLIRSNLGFVVRFGNSFLLDGFPGSEVLQKRRLEWSVHGDVPKLGGVMLKLKSNATEIRDKTRNVIT